MPDSAWCLCHTCKRNARTHTPARNHFIHLFAILCISQLPEMMPHEPLPADISASITAGGATDRENMPVIVCLPGETRECGATRRTHVLHHAGMNALTVLRASASFDKREPRVAGRQGAAARDLDAPLCELDLLRGAVCADCGTHHGATCDRFAAANLLRIRRQRPRRKRYNKSHCDRFRSHYMFASKIPSRGNVVPPGFVVFWRQKPPAEYNANCGPPTRRWASAAGSAAGGCGRKRR
jgi:hypothetical protein